MAPEQRDNRMKYVKMLGFAAIAAAALMAFAGAGTASATVLCSTTVETCPSAQRWPITTLNFSLLSGASLEWVNEGETLQTCKGASMKMDMTNAGNSTSTVEASTTSPTFSQCTTPNTFTKWGGVEIHRIGGTSNGTMTAAGEFGWTFNTVFFGSCLYGWEKGGVIGTLLEGKPAVLELNTAIHKLSGSAFACPENGTLKGSLTLTEPSSTTLSVASG
jgi:hypothetical protein